MRPEDTLEQMGPQIRQFLTSQRRGEAMASLRKTAVVDVRLDPPRASVAATGPSRGPADAPVTIVEFSDYQCPFCSRAEPTVQEVLRRYPTEVRLVYRHFPLDSIHPRARPASEAAACADQQNQFWSYHEKLFANQRSLGDADLLRYAEEIGLDTEAFESCRQSNEVKQIVSKDQRAGAAAGATGTPAFYINGIHLSGARPIDDFVDVIESELERGGEGGTS